MPWIFTNTITGLPFYQLKAEFISRAGTGTLTATNGGYIATLGEISKELEEGTGAYRPGEISLGLKNVDNVFSTNVFTLDSHNNVEFRLWVSYDSGSTWENLFFGLISMNDWTYSDVEDTETRVRVYNCRAYSMFLSLKEVEIDFINSPITANIETAQLNILRTDQRGTPNWFIMGALTGSPDVNFVQLREVLNYLCQGMQFVDGTTRPTIVINTTALTHQGYSLKTNAEYGFSDLYVYYTSELGEYIAQGLLASHFMEQSGKASAYDAKNFQELLKRWCEWLAIVPTAVLTESGGAYTCTVTFRPRFFHDLADIPAISGTLDKQFTRAFQIGQWFDGAQTSTVGLPHQTQLVQGESSNVVEVRQYFCTAPYFAVDPNPAFIDPYTFAEATVIDSATAEKMDTRTLPAQMLFAKVSSGVMTNVHKFRHDAKQPFYEVGQSGYYGVQFSAFQFIAIWDPRARSNGIGRRGLSVTYRTLKGSAVADLELQKKLTYNSNQYIITGVSRDAGQNTTVLKLMEVK